jgi:hypothetical protein
MATDGRVDFTAPDEGFRLEETPKPKIQRDPSPQKETLYVGRRCIAELQWQETRSTMAHKLRGARMHIND